jgi:NADH:ubiquinone oxidoreductase subunit E
MKINVCIGSSCHLKGSRLVVSALQELVKAHGLETSVDLCGKFCMGNCQKGVSIEFNGKHFSANEENIENLFHKEILSNIK